MTTPEDVERAKREAVRCDVVTVRWNCRKVKIHGMSIIGVCRAEFEGSVSRADFNARDARARCPSCGGMLTQKSDGYEEVTQ